MSSKLNIEPRVRSLVSYLDDIENGLLQIPSFQRDYVWERDDIKDLFDSIKNRYPIGSVLLWKPGEQIGDDKQKIGSYTTPKNQNDKVYILDGYQRLSTLFGCLTNPDKTQLSRDKKEWQEYYSLYYDLADQAFIYIRPNSQPLPFQVPIYVLLNSSDFRQFARNKLEQLQDKNLIDIYLDRADKLSRVFLEYKIASVDINNANISEAVEIFSRVNSKGQPISFDWMANALSVRNDFRFGSEIDNLIEDIKQYNFDKIDRNVIFRCIQSSFGKLYIDNTKIEHLARRKDFSLVTQKTIPKIKEAIKFLFEDLLVLDNKLLPYNIQLIFIMDFFKKFENPTEEEKNKLKDWFWITTYSNYFTNYSLANQRKAYNHFQRFLDGDVQNPVYNDKPELKFVVADFPDKISLGSVRAKALTLFLLNHSNNFEKVSSCDINGFKFNKLLPTVVSKSDNYLYFTERFLSSENTVPLIEFEDGRYNNDIKAKNLMHWLHIESSDIGDKNFITNKMKQAFAKYEYEEVLRIRAREMQDAEKLFVSKYGLEYNFSFSTFF